MAQGRFVLARKIDTQNPTATPVLSTYYDGGVNFVANCVDAVRIGVDIYVAVTSYNSTAGQGAVTRHSILNQSTGAEHTSPAGVNSHTYNPANQANTAQCNSGVSFLQDQPGGTFGYYVFWTVGTSDSKIRLRLLRFILSSLNVSTTWTIGSEITSHASDLGQTHAGIASGYFDPSDNTPVIFAQAQHKTEPTAGTADFTYGKTITREVLNTGTGVTTTTVFARGATLASKPFKDTTTGKWFILTQYDDSESIAVQRAWHVRMADRAGPTPRNVVAQIGWGQGGAAYHMWQSDRPAPSPSLQSHSLAWCPPVPLSGTTFLAPIELADGLYKTAPQILALETAAAWGQPTKLFGNLLCYPAGVPQVVGPADMSRDLSPLMGPTIAPTAAVGTGSDLQPAFVTYGYRTRTSDGQVTRSLIYPTPTSLTWKDAGTRQLHVQNLRHIGRDGNGAEIEVWATKPGGLTLHLQFALPNDPTLNTASVDVQPENWNELGEQLPVGLVPSPPPPARVAVTAFDKLFLSGTDVTGELWYSQPFEQGFGVELNAASLRQIIPGGAVTAGALVDFNSLALFRRSGITVIQNEPISGLGGFYQPLDLLTEHGVEKSSTRGNTVTPSSKGVFYQSASDGRVQCLLPSLQVVEAGKGINSLALAQQLTAGAEIANDGAVWLQFADGTTAAADHRHATPTSPFGVWSAWTSSALTAANSYSVGLVDAGGTPLWLQRNGPIRRPKTGSDSNQWQDDTSGGTADVLMKLKTGKVAPAGMKGEVAVRRLQVLGTHLGSSTLQVTTWNDAGTPDPKSVVTGSPIDYQFQPSNLLRSQEMEVQIEETVSSTEGFTVEGLAFEFSSRGHMKRLPASKFL